MAQVYIRNDHPMFGRTEPVAVDSSDPIRGGNTPAQILEANGFTVEGGKWILNGRFINVDDPLPDDDKICLVRLCKIRGI